MKNRIIALMVLFSLGVNAQEVVPKEKLNFYGGFESNSQWYLNDEGLGVDHPDIPARSNNYLFLNLK